MVIVYKKVLLLDMKSFFKETFLKLSPYLFVSLGVGLLCEAYNPIENVLLEEEFCLDCPLLPSKCCRE